MARYFSADFHFYHKNIIKYEPEARGHFSGVHEMNDAIVNNINAVCKPDDELYFLGDFAFASLNQYRRLIESINPQIHFINGNHDPSFAGKSPTKRQRAYDAMLEAGVASIQDSATLIIGNHNVNLSHFPYRNSVDGDSGHVDRFEEYRLEDDGNWLICGHVHGKWRVNGHMINVGVDVWNLLPVFESTILEIIDR